jgi:NADH-quinone oxidoreductase subunit G
VVRKAQEGILEFLLINHPLDCPVCDRGGECPLQDQTMAYGPGESRFVEEKRHYEKPIPISDLVLLDRERCILCARCTRFSDEISGDPLIEFKNRGNGTQVLTFPDEPFASYFSGNTVQICPVGALTAKPYRFRARPWDLEAVESVSLVDTVHSKVSVQASQNEVLRINAVDSDATNHGWLSDKDRFIFQSLGSDQRLTMPLIRDEAGFRTATWGEALDEISERLGAFRGDEVAGLGGARSTNEEAYAFGKFLRTVVVTPHLDCQLDDGLDPQFLAGVVPRGGINDLENAATILVWGPDLKEELPVLYLRVRRAAAELGATLIVVHPRRTGLDDVATHKVTYRPGEGPETLRKLVGGAVGGGDFTVIREALEAGPVVALVGRCGLTEDPRLPEAVAAFARDLPGASILPLARRGNVFGALDMGLAPTLLPGRVSVMSEPARISLEDLWGPLPEGVGLGASGILTSLADGALKALVMLGSDPVGDFPNRALAERALAAAEFVVSFDLFLNASSAHADVVLPVEGFAESEGTVTNLEGRVQKVNRIRPGPGQSRPAWSVLDDLARRMGGELGASSASNLAKEIEAMAPAYGGVSWELLDWGDGRDGVVVPTSDGSQPLQYVPADPKLPSGTSGTALHLARVLYDRGVAVSMSPSLAAIVPEAAAYLHPRDAGAMAIKQGDMVSITGDGPSVDLPVVIDPSLAPGTVYVPFNLDATAGFWSTGGVAIEASRGEG